jgi:hypothetical protein
MNACVEIRVPLFIALLMVSISARAAEYDPLAYARAHTEKISAAIPKIPAQCYTKTTTAANPCWACHTSANGRNELDDWKLQTADGFGDTSRINHWQNLFLDNSSLTAPSDAEVQTYIAQDNYTPLRNALHNRNDYAGWQPDLDLNRGFDKQGFALDGSWWRAIRYKPFLGAFWPTNGGVDDVFIRLPWRFRYDVKGNFSLAIYKVNLSILEAAMTVPAPTPDSELTRVIEPTDERVAGMDINGDGRIGGTYSVIVGLPEHYAGAAQDTKVERYSYPRGTEFLHTVRYVDVSATNLMSKRMKEVRYSVKTTDVDAHVVSTKYAAEKGETPATEISWYPGSADIGYVNEFGWRLQGFIEDAEGRLRAQTPEEHFYCMGCHESIGVTVDQTFAFPRKLPGLAGWRNQTLQGQHDAPQAGQSKPEYLTYMLRAGGADEFRSNAEMNSRFFMKGAVNEKEVLRAAKDGDRDLAWLVAPSPSRATALNRSYMQLVKMQKFELGRDGVMQPPETVYQTVPDPNKPEDRAPVPTVYKDGRLWLDWK